MSDLPDSMSRLRQWLSQTDIGTEKHRDEHEHVEDFHTDVGILHSLVNPEHDIGTDKEEGTSFAANLDGLKGLKLSIQEQNEGSLVEDDTLKSGLDLSTSFRRCISEYRNLLFAISGQSEAEGSLAFERMLEEYGRLKLWGDQNRALLPHVPGSLSYVLRDQPEMLDTTRSTFMRLVQSLESANVVATKGPVLDFDKLNDLDEDSESDLSSESETSEGQSENSQAEEPLYVLLRRIYDQIGFIFQLGSLIRERRFHDRYLHSSFSHGSTSVSMQDNEHIRVKLDRWKSSGDTEDHMATAHQSKGKTPIYLLPRVDVEDTVSPEALSQRMIAEARQSSLDHELIRRLAFANTRRRHQFIYWETHPYSAAPVAGIQNDGGNATSEKGSKGHTIRTFSSIAKSAVASSALEADANATTYAPSIVDDTMRTTARVPNVPSQSTDAPTFECPFCHMILDSAPMQNRQTWKRHVFRDLRPYVCTYQDCPTPHRMYATRYDWIYHESQLHQRQWRCQECYEVFDSKTVFRTHLETSHPGIWNATQISILTDMGEEPKNEASEHACHFCLQHISLKRMPAHVADHMEELSLFSLPNVDFEEDTSTGDDGQSLSKDRAEASEDLKNRAEPALANEERIEGLTTQGRSSIADMAEIDTLQTSLESDRGFTQTTPQVLNPEVSRRLIITDNELRDLRINAASAESSRQDASPVQESDYLAEFEYTKPSDLARYDLDQPIRDRPPRKTSDANYSPIRSRVDHRPPDNFIPWQGAPSSIKMPHHAESGGLPDGSDADDETETRGRLSVRKSAPSRRIERITRQQSPELIPVSIVTTDHERYRAVSPHIQEPQKGILKKATAQFPEFPDQAAREGTTSRKVDSSKKEVPPGARWTKINRRLVNPEALTIGKERFEVRDDFIIVLRVLSKEEIQAYATATAQLRVMRDKEYQREREHEREREPEPERKLERYIARDDEPLLESERGRARDLERERESSRKRELEFMRMAESGRGPVRVIESPLRPRMN